MAFMRGSLSRRAALSAIVLCLACGRGGVPVGPPDGSGGPAGGGSGGAAGGAAGGGGTSAVSPPSSNALGTAAYDLTVPGQGSCAGASLAQAISAVHAGWPALADIGVLYDPTRLGDGSFIY